MQIKDLTGQRFGRLTAVKRVGSYWTAWDEGSKPTWECTCDCGNTVVVWGEHLRSGNTRSCGCLRRETAPKNRRRRRKPKAPIVDAPCGIGDVVWVLRSFKGIKHAKQGIVSQLFYTADKKVMIVVKGIARGYWGENIFATLEEAEKAKEET